MAMASRGTTALRAKVAWDMSMNARAARHCAGKIDMGQSLSYTALHRSWILAERAFGQSASA